MPVIPLDALDDPRLNVYRQLKKTNATRWSNHFIAEGKKLVIRLLASDFEIESILTSKKYLDLLEPHIEARPELNVYAMSHAHCQMVVGFAFHCGMLGCGLRKPNPSIAEITRNFDDSSKTIIVACMAIQNPDNVGTIIRIASAFGASAVLFADGCGDPFSRRALRVSMGTGLTIPIIDSTDDEVEQLLVQLQRDHHMDLVSTELSEDAEVLRETQVGRSSVLMFGNEDAGLDQRWIDLSTRRVTIPMENNTDSLNVGVAAGIVLHHFASQ